MISFSKIGYLGRLGNQMFQFASTVGISKKINLEAKFPVENCFFQANIGPFDPKTGTNMPIKCDLLDCFNISPSFFIPGNHIRNLISFEETSFEYDDQTEKIKDSTDITGYFQTEKYFSHCRGFILSEFSFKEEFRNNSRIYIEEIRKKNDGCEIVSIHVRRGDYLQYPDHHPVCSPEYYNSSIDRMKSEIGPKVKFIIFSDDPEWCIANFSGDDFHISDLGNQFSEMSAMSLCDHHIIANSSFSWWGAWLNRSSNKKVIAPKNWFGPLIQKNTSDIYCTDWIKI